MTDINGRTEIEILVNTFYDTVKNDALIGDVFKKRIPDDQWPIHLNKMYGFWNTVLFGKAEYRGNPFSHHLGLNIKKEHFDRWMSLFEQVIHDNFKGAKADETLLRAGKMRLMFESKLNGLSSDSQHLSIL